MAVSYRDLYLKAPDAAALDAALRKAGVLVDAGEERVAVADGFALDVVGTLYAPPVQTGTDKAGLPVYAPPVALPGYHANLRCLTDPTPDLRDALAAITIAPPAHPRVEWAGGMFPV